MSELRFDVKQLIKDWNDCPEDDGFTDDHPILLMAMDVDDMRQIIREKEARIARLESALQECIPILACTEPYIAEACTAQLNESPQASLAEIEAAAVEPIYNELRSFRAFSYGGVIMFPEHQYNNIVKHINNLRAEGK